MASKAAAAAETTEAATSAPRHCCSTSSRPRVKKLIARGKERGYVTYDELNAALPQDQVSSEQIEDTMAMLSEMGINVVESEETRGRRGRAGRQARREERGRGARTEARPATSTRKTLGRTDDPVRMYLREMGAVELLSREGEIAIAKRIEAGRDMMIGGLCESPLTFQRHHRLARRAEGRPRCCCATSSTSRRRWPAAPPASRRDGAEADEAGRGRRGARTPGEEGDDDEARTMGSCRSRRWRRS